MERLKALAPKGLDVDSAPGEWGTPHDVFEMAVRWLGRGEPVYFTTSDECWVSFSKRSPEELEYVRHMILDHKGLVDKMLQGLDKAQRRLAKLSESYPTDNAGPLE